MKRAIIGGAVLLAALSGCASGYPDYSTPNPTTTPESVQEQYDSTDGSGQYVVKHPNVETYQLDTNVNEVHITMTDGRTVICIDYGTYSGVECDWDHAK